MNDIYWDIFENIQAVKQSLNSFEKAVVKNNTEDIKLFTEELEYDVSSLSDSVALLEVNDEDIEDDPGEFI